MVGKGDQLLPGTGRGTAARSDVVEGAWSESRDPGEGSMKAAILRQPGTPLTIEEARLDDPGPREVRIRTAACGQCQSDLHFIEGT